jgi:hypothetical protein
MKRVALFLFLLVFENIYSQEHFSGISTSKRVGILNASINPAELINLNQKYEINIFGLSVNAANNKVGFNDLNSDDNLEDILFRGNAPVNARFNAEVSGPGFAMRWKKWGFALTTKSHVKFDLVDVDVNIGNAINNGEFEIATTLLNNNNNQRFSGSAYGEVGLSLARNFYENDKHRLSFGTTLKLLFPSTYANFGLSKLDGQITQIGGESYLSTTESASLNISYSGNLADDFSNSEDYTKSIFGSLNGFAADFGVNYRLKDSTGYKINAGFSVKNIGSMTFKDKNNHNTNYELNIPVSNPLNLSQFDGIENLAEIERILDKNGYLNSEANNTDFKVKLPTVITTYADFKVYRRFHITGYLQQKLSEDSDNQQLTTPNIFSITPRINLGYFEGYVPVTFHEISGTNVGLGFRLGGFYIGTSSLITAMINDSKQADAYLGFRWSFVN